MTNDSRTNQTYPRQQSESSTADDTTNTKRISYLSKQFFSSMNSMQFVEISPLNSINNPHPRSGHRAVATESDFWMWGGYHPSNDNRSQPMFNEV
jgi:hypothetical protein